MSTFTEIGYEAMAPLNLWFRVQQGTPLKLTDFPQLISNRWSHFRDRWNFVRQKYVDQVDSYDDPNRLRKSIESMDQFIDSQRTFNSKQNPFQKSDTLFRFYAIFDTTNINDIPMTQDETTFIREQVRKVRAYTRDNFVDIRKKLVIARDGFADTRGLTDVDYNRVFNRSSVDKQVNITNASLNELQNFMDAIKTIDFILANQFSLETGTIDPFALARANAQNPDVEINQYSAGFLIKLNYGEDLRSVALRYLGDDKLWQDIAIANGLKPPYIDEVGERIQLIANGRQSKISLNETDDNGNLNIDKFHVNQVLFIQSDSYRFPDQRIVVNIEQIPISGEIIVELDGEPDLNKYKLNENAHIRVFKPNTINSNFYLLIPTQQNLEDDRKDITPWFLRQSGEDEKRAKVDLLLSETNDLNFGNTGDFNLSYGLTNAVQSLKLKFGVEEGELRQHSNYGLISLQGKTNNNIEGLKQSLTDSINSMVENDSRFDRIESLDVAYLAGLAVDSPAAFYIKMNVRLAGGNQVIPINFRVNVG